MVNVVVTVTAGATASTVPVDAADGLPAGSVATTVTLSPSLRSPGFGTVHLPSGPATTVAVVPSGKVTLTVEPASAVPVTGLVALIGSITGAFGAVVSTVTTALVVPTLPAGSVAVTVTVCGPSVNTGSVLSARVQVPSPLLVAG
ncbi:Uncharacterised protein [Acinetobacter baumannii]|nr:Uncharacterised protein [Acinetobacter baumannii]